MANNATRSGLAALPVAIALAGHLVTVGTGEAGIRVRAAATVGIPELVADALADEERQSLAVNLPLGAPVSTRPAIHRYLVRNGYVLAHNSVDRIADWVAYRVTREQAEAEKTRAGDPFDPDPLIPRGHRAELDDYAGFLNVFDRGHQMPAGAASGLGVAVVRESFLLSNMTPQAASLNRGQWRSLEARELDWAASRGRVWVITGPVFEDDDGDGLVAHAVIGPNQVAVPTHYFKIIYSIDDDEEVDAQAFLIPNERIANFREHLTSVDEVERLTGFDMLPDLDDNAEDDLEARLPARVWNDN